MGCNALNLSDATVYSLRLYWDAIDDVVRFWRLGFIYIYIAWKGTLAPPLPFFFTAESSRFSLRCYHPLAPLKITPLCARPMCADTSMALLHFAASVCMGKHLLACAVT